MVNMSILLALNEKKNAGNIIIVLPKAEDKSVSGSASIRSKRYFTARVSA